ncbi:MAG: DivIVA domain-containing protein [Clostridiales bacterium]|jgi:cell division septum initiation protein DivIVA|nr:DivIVA domain-containing protein [Clostridiales bacterium]
MADGGVKFAEQPMGYDKQQVDSYITKLTYEYNAMHNEYLNLVTKCNSLSETCLRLSDEKNRLTEALNQQPSQSRENESAIAKAIIDAEMLAKQIVDRANTESAKIEESIRMAREEMKQLQLMKDKMLIEIHEMRKRFNSIFSE